jgi:hypothetical protein
MAARTSLQSAGRALSRDGGVHPVGPTRRQSAEEIQMRARACMELDQDEIDAVNQRILDCLAASPPILMIPMHRIVVGAASDWLIVSDMYAFCETYAQVQIYKQTILSDEEFSAVLAPNVAEYTYCMGLMQHFRAKGLLWLTERRRMILTPKKREPAAPPSAFAQAVSGALRSLLGPSAAPSAQRPTKPHVTKGDHVVFEYLLSVDMGRSALAKVGEETDAARITRMMTSSLTEARPLQGSPRAQNPYSPRRRTEEESEPVLPATPRAQGARCTTVDPPLPGPSPHSPDRGPRGYDPDDLLDDADAAALEQALSPALARTFSGRAQPAPDNDESSSSSDDSGEEVKAVAASPRRAHVRSMSSGSVVSPRGTDKERQPSPREQEAAHQTRRAGVNFIPLDLKRPLPSGQPVARRPSATGTSPRRSADASDSAKR